MRELKLKDIRRISRFVGVALDSNEDAPFPAAVLAELQALIPADSVFFAESDRVAQAGLSDSFVGVEEIQAPEENYWPIRHQSPICEFQERTGDWRAVRKSDFIGRRELHRRAIYHDWFRPWGVEHQLAAGLDSPLTHAKTFLFARRDGSDFSERDRDVLDALLPWLARLYRVAQDRRRLRQALGRLDHTESEVAVRLVTAREREVLELVREGLTNAEIARTLWVAPGTVRRHLENAYAKLGVHTRTAAVARLRDPQGELKR